MLNRIAVRVLGMMPRHIKYRLGRKLYLQARGDTSNRIDSNGERLVQRSVIEARKRAGGDLLVLDVGANQGQWTLAFVSELANSGFSGLRRMHAFEPVPSTFAMLRNNVPQCDWLHLEPMALSAEPGNAEIFLTGDGAGTNSLHKSPGQEKSVHISLDSADSFCRNRGIQHVHLFKCDTEGHDMEVIRGASDLLRHSQISVLQFEYNHRWVYSRNFLHDVFTAIRGLPYSVAKIQSDHILRLDAWHPELEKFFEGNYLIIHDAALGWFPTRPIRFDSSNVPVQV